VVVVDESGVLADRTATEAGKVAVLDTLFTAASPSPGSMRASPDYRLAMLRVLGLRGVAAAAERLASGAA
jgi:hypothetical protein